MGLYAEPKGEKEEWIRRMGRPMLGTVFESVPPGRLAVVLLHQGFTALGIAYNKHEFRRYMTGRPDGEWFTVEKHLLAEVTPGAKEMREFK